MTPAAKTKVFISYARADDHPDYDDASKSFVRRLYNLLTAAGFDVWWDRKSLPSRGEEFTKEIEDAIRANERFVLITGEGIHKSDYVRAEWECALALCKPITPIVFDNDFSFIPNGIENKHAVDFGDLTRFDERLAELVRVLSDEVNPLGILHSVEKLPPGFIPRATPYKTACESLLQNEISATVVSTTVQSATSVYGQGGVGKSTLAIAIGRDCDIRRRFKDGVIWVKVGQGATPTQLQSTIGVTVYKDNPEYYKTERDGWLALSQVLRDKQALIILDDVWEHELVNHFPVADTGCRLLITTRSASLAGYVNGLDVRLDVLTPEEGARLIAARVGGDEKPVYLQISTELNGHTLAVVLAAARLKKKGINYAQTILEGLKNATDPFAHLVVDDEDKNLNLSKSLALSYDDLSLDAQKRFRSLGVFAMDSTFPIGALANLWSENETNADLYAEALTDTSLLDYNPDTNRYTQHRVLRVYARALLIENGEFDTVFARYADWVIAQAFIFNSPQFKIWQDSDWLVPHTLEVGDTLTNRYQNLMQDRQALLTLYMRDFFNYRSDLVNYQVEGATYSRNNWYQNAINYLNTIKDISNEAESQIASLLYSLSDIYVREGKWMQAEKILLESLEISKRLKRINPIAAAKSKLADLYVNIGQLDHALKLYQEAIAEFQKIDAFREIAIIQGSISDLYLRQGKHDKALELLELSLKTQKELGNLHEIAVAQNAKADLYIREERLEEALLLLESSLDIVESLNDSQGIAIVQSTIAEIHSKNGNLNKAEELYFDSLNRVKNLNDLRSIAAIQTSIADLYVGQGKWDKTLELYEESLKIFLDFNLNREIAITQNMYGQALIITRHNLDLGVDMLWQSYIRTVRLKNPHEVQLMQEVLIDIKKRLGIRFDEIWKKQISESQPDWLARVMLAVSTLPQETVQYLAGNTITVKTDVPNKLDEWRDTLTSARSQFAGRGDDWANEVAFADALLAILNDQPPVIAPDNPYAGVIRQVVEVIAKRPS